MANLTVNPSTGNGNQTVTVQTGYGDYTGRTDRTTKLGFRVNASNTDDAIVTVIEKKVPLFLNLKSENGDDNVYIDPSNANGEAVVLGSTNARTFEISISHPENVHIEEGSLVIMLGSETYTATSYSPGNLTDNYTFEAPETVGAYKAEDIQILIETKKAYIIGESYILNVTAVDNETNPNEPNSVERRITLYYRKENYVYLNSNDNTSVTMILDSTNKTGSVNVLSNTDWTTAQN